MDVNNMVAALAAKTVDAMVNVEPYNAIAEADGIATEIMDFSSVDKMPVFMAATPDFVQKNPDDGRRLSARPGSKSRATSRRIRAKVADVIFGFYTDKGYTMSRDTFAKALARVDVNPGFPTDLKPYMQEQARNPAAREEDLRDPGLEQGAAPGLHGEGAGRGVTPPLFLSR